MSMADEDLDREARRLFEPITKCSAPCGAKLSVEDEVKGKCPKCGGVIKPYGKSLVCTHPCNTPLALVDELKGKCPKCGAEIYSTLTNIER
jgi:predicted RNA-binding Zn-ribbon protein involved in translation (DUF1610 family)